MLNGVAYLQDVLPVINPEELNRLAARYGSPQHRAVYLQADKVSASYRFPVLGKSTPTQKGQQAPPPQPIALPGDRRAEVVFAIQDLNGGLWVHNKKHYPPSIYRLPSGGVHWQEGIEEALLREISEETGLPVSIQRFLGLVEYYFYHEGQVAHFASYLFHLSSQGGEPNPHEIEGITAFQRVLPSQLLTLAADLRNLTGDYHHWGQWRAVVHELAYETLKM